MVSKLGARSPEIEEPIGKLASPGWCLWLDGAVRCTARLIGSLAEEPIGRLAFPGADFALAAGLWRGSGKGVFMEGEIMVRDPVCGMDVDEREARKDGLTAEFGGQIRFFCSEECRDMFVKSPTAHWQAQQGQGRPDERPGQQAK